LQSESSKSSAEPAEAARAAPGGAEPFPGARAWRVFIECAWAVPDILDAELRAAQGMSLRWYDVLVHLEDAPDGMRMNDLAEHILHSKSGLTRVIDNMEKAGLVTRERPASDRRVVLVFLTPDGKRALQAARAVHRDGIRRHFADHLSKKDRAALMGALEHVRAHARPLRPGRVSGGS
jgi:DNA-binding MarR family transcriptional regulator